MASSSGHRPVDDIVHIKSFVGDHVYLSSLTERLLKVKSEAMVHKFDIRGKPGGVPVKARPKQVYGLRNGSGEFGLYYWGQVKEDFMLINDMPEFASEFLGLVIEKLVSLSNTERPMLQPAVPFFRKMNHMLLTFGEDGTKAIPPHNDKAYSSYTDGGRFESGTPILLFNFGATRKFMISTNKASSAAGVHDTEYKMVKADVFVKGFTFESGDLIILPGHVNVLHKHSIEVDPRITAPRISIVIRLVDASFVNPEQNYYIHGGTRAECGNGWPRQSLLPEELRGCLIKQPEQLREGPGEPVEEDDYHPVDDVVHIENFVEESIYFKELTRRLLSLDSLAHASSDGKKILTFSTRNEAGDFGLYRWGQPKEHYLLVEEMPSFGVEFKDFVMHKLKLLGDPQWSHMMPFVEKMNHMQLSFGDERVPQHHQAFSTHSDGQLENGTPILHFNFGATGKFVISTKEASSEHITEDKMEEDNVLVQVLDFKGGDLIMMPGYVNEDYKHSFHATGARVSVILRLVDANFVNPQQGYYILAGSKYACDLTWPRQLPLDCLQRSNLKLPEYEDGFMDGFEVSAGPPQILVRLLQELEVTECSSIDGFESPLHLNFKLAQLGLLNPQEESEAMEGWDYDIGSTRLVGRLQMSGGCAVNGTFATPYWETASRRALVDGLMAMRSVATVDPEVDVPVPEDMPGESYAFSADDILEEALDIPVPDNDSDPEETEGSERHGISFEQLCDMDYYEAFGVSPKAKENDITAAFKKLAKTHHPDKGGDPRFFMVYKYMYEVLNDKTKRKQYDKEGRVPFAAAMPNNPHAPAGPSILRHVSYTEHINVDMAKRFLGLVAMRQLKINGNSSFSFADLLQSFIDRSHKGTITAHWHENEKAREMGLKGRRNAGFGNDDFLYTIGCFPLPKLIRYILRSGFGGRMVDLDQTDAYWHCLLEVLDDWKLKDKYPFVVARVEQKEVFYNALPGSDDDKKKVFLTILFQGALPDGMPEIVFKLNQEVACFMRQVKSQRKDLCKIAASWGKKRPEVTVASYLMMDKERKHLDEMMAAAGDCVMSPEADGLVVFDALPEVIENIHKACAVPLKVKPYPQTFEAIIEFAKSKYPGLSWGLQAKYSWSELQESMECIKHDLSPLREKDDALRAGHTDFAKVVAASCEGRLMLDGGFLYECLDSGLWTVDTKDFLHGAVRQRIHSIFGFTETSVIKGQLHIHTKGVPKMLKDHSFLTNVREEVKSFILGKAPKLDESTRGLLAFSDGSVYDFVKGEVRMAHQQDLIRRRVPWPYKEIAAGLQGTWDLLIKDIIAHWEAGGGDLHENSEAPVEDEAAKAVRESLKGRLQRVCKQSEFLKVVLSICKENVDELLYLLQHFCRMMSAFPRLCELLYIHGPKKAGKDVLASLIQAFFGDKSNDGFCASLPNDYFEQKPGAYGKRGSEESHPMLHSIRDTRVVLIPEAPNGQTNMSQLKPLCEQQGAKITSRTHCRDPERSHPTYEFIFFSNHNMEIGPSPDSGEARRVNVFRLCNQFGSKSGDSAEQADLKERIIGGCFVHEMFHLTKVLYPALNTLYTTNIRRPARIEHETWEVTQSSLSDAEVRKYILETLEASDEDNCSTEKQVKIHIAEYFRCTTRQVANKMVDLGFDLNPSNRTSAKRYCKYLFEDGQEKKPVLIKPRSF